MQDWLIINHSISTADGYLIKTVTLEEGSWYEWQFLHPNGNLIYQSQQQHGNPLAALKDGLVVVLGESTLERDHKEAIRQEIQKGIQKGIP